MKKLIFLMTLIFSSNIAYAQIEYPYGVSAPADTDLKGLKFNRYTTDNFVILSINNAQGKWLSENLEQIEKWCLSRWGFPEKNRSGFTKECRIFCVPNKDLLKKIFNIDEPVAEARKKDGKLEITVMWLVLDAKPSSSVVPYLTQICLTEFEEKNNVNIGYWFKRGASLLNRPIFEIKKDLVDLASVIKKNEAIFASDQMFTFTEEEYLKQSEENKKLFDQEAIALCLMLRKEFGEAKLQGMLRLANRNNPQDVLKVVYGFSGYNHFDKQYIRFMRDLSADILKGKTPDKYLEIIPVSR